MLLFSPPCYDLLHIKGLIRETLFKVVGEVNIMGATFVYDAGDVNGQFKIW